MRASETTVGVNGAVTRTTIIYCVGRLLSFKIIVALPDMVDDCGEKLCYRVSLFCFGVVFHLLEVLFPQRRTDIFT